MKNNVVFKAKKKMQIILNKIYFNKTSLNWIKIQIYFQQQFSQVMLKIILEFYFISLFIQSQISKLNA